MKKLLIAAILLITPPSYAETAGPWAINTKACKIAKEKLFAADNKDAEKLESDFNCACDVRTSEIKPFSECGKGQLKRLRKAN